MKGHGTLKLNVGGKIRTLNYTTQENKVYVLTKNDSKKITDINANSQVELAFSAQEKVTAIAKIMTDQSVVKAIFDKMLSEDNTHFKVYKENLVVIEFTI